MYTVRVFGIPRKSHKEPKLLIHLNSTPKPTMNYDDDDDNNNHDQETTGEK